MGRAPCCEKMGLKKGPWTLEEDHILISFIQQHGHGNWRALPKQAGLLRCGKSCRLRWTNYLRPDIKRGNFSREEEETIINLHGMLGNRWSAIAAQLPGRTDNEIKNVWHTHLKKSLTRISPVNSSKKEQEPVNSSTHIAGSESLGYGTISPDQCSSSCDISCVTSNDNNSNDMCTKVETSENVYEMDENFWSEVLSSDNPSGANDFTAVGGSMDFWYNIFTRAGELQ